MQTRPHCGHQLAEFENIGWSYMYKLLARPSGLILIALAFVFAGNACAGVLTQEAMDAGFRLETFVKGFSQHSDQIGNIDKGGLGPIGIAFVGDGVIVSDADGYIRSLLTRDNGQTIPLVDSSTTPSYGFVGAVGLAELNGQYYAGGYLQNAGLLAISSTGAYQSNISHNRIRSLAVDSVHNVLYAAGTGVFRYDPATQSYANLVNLVPASSAFDIDFNVDTEVDGIATDGTTLYLTSSFTGNDWESVRGYRLSDGAKVFDSGGIDGVDGTALGKGALAGKLYANTNFGELYEIDLLDPTQRRLIFTGGTRGDFVTVDPFNGTLLITQSEEILRLTAPSGGSFSTVPEPSSYLVFAASVLFAVAFRKRKR